MTHRPRFVIVSIIIIALGVASWWSGFLNGFSTIAPYETIMIAALAAYAAIGAVAAFRGKFDAARHVANGLPIWALCATGLGILLAVSQFRGVNPESLTSVFKNMALAISPNIVGIGLMAAIREAMHWSSGEAV